MQENVLLNPFVVGKYVSERYFCDRKDETDFLVKQIENGRNVALISPIHCMIFRPVMPDPPNR